jgi:predicted transcriptional regulator
MEDEREPEEIDPAHLLGVLEGLAEAKRGEFSSDEEVKAAFQRFAR